MMTYDNNHSKTIEHWLNTNSGVQKLLNEDSISIRGNGTCLSIDQTRLTQPTPRPILVADHLNSCKCLKTIGWDSIM